MVWDGVVCLAFLGERMILFDALCAMLTVVIIVSKCCAAVVVLFVIGRLYDANETSCESSGLRPW